jgi:CBS domain containing-hemolysin-like protein
MEIYIIIGVLLILSGMFSGLEIAFVSANKFKIELGKGSKSISDRILSKFALNDSLFITVLLIGNNIILVVLGHFMAESLVNDFDYQNLFLQTIITTIIVLVFGEFIPKTLFSIAPNKILKYFAIPINLIYIPLKYVAIVFNFLSSKLIGLFTNIAIEENTDQFSSSDLKHYIKGLVDEENSDGDDDDINVDFIEKAINFKDIKVRECMVPRTEVKAINISTPISELIGIFTEYKHSRMLVFKENIDDIVGYIHHFDLFKNPKTSEEVLYEIISVPETMNARDLLSSFTAENKNIAHVFDEHGGTSGIVTLEDLMEEIFGEIEDEHDNSNFKEEKKGDNHFIFSARLEVDYLNEKYKLEIPEGDYETLAGFIVVSNEDIPQKDELVIIEDFEIKILQAEYNKLDLVELKKRS